MSDFRDVMEARIEASRAVNIVTGLGSYQDDNGRGSIAQAVYYSTLAICAEIRALAVLIDFAADAS